MNDTFLVMDWTTIIPALLAQKKSFQDLTISTKDFGHIEMLKMRVIVV